MLFSLIGLVFCSQSFCSYFTSLCPAIPSWFVPDVLFFDCTFTISSHFYLQKHPEFGCPIPCLKSVWCWHIIQFLYFPYNFITSINLPSIRLSFPQNRTPAQEEKIAYKNLSATKGTCVVPSSTQLHSTRLLCSNREAVCRGNDDNTSTHSLDDRMHFGVKWDQMQLIGESTPSACFHALPRRVTVLSDNKSHQDISSSDCHRDLFKDFDCDAYGATYYYSN